jgi:hypothetical protein
MTQGAGNSRQIAKWAAGILVALSAVLGYWLWTEPSPTLAERAEAAPDAPAGLYWDGTGDTVTVSFHDPTPETLDWLGSYMDDVGLSSEATMARLRATRALDGTMEATGDGVTVTWTSHPDTGLRLVFSKN